MIEVPVDDVVGEQGRAMLSGLGAKSSGGWTSPGACGSSSTSPCSTIIGPTRANDSSARLRSPTFSRNGNTITIS
jgi:hypothetical protein